MNRRKLWWKVSEYGPGLVLVAVGVWGLTTGGGMRALFYLAVGVTLVLHGYNAENLYRAAYFRGRAEQLHDIYRFGKGQPLPGPDELDPHPWDGPPPWWDAGAAVVRREP